MVVASWFLLKFETLSAMKEINDELTYAIIACAMKVHNTRGNGFPSAAKGLPTTRQEVIYQRCLAIELEKRGIQFLREQEMPIYYDDVPVGTRRADFIVGKTVLIELKAVIKLEDVHLAQGLNYLEAYKIEKGLLINFGAPALEVKRLFRKRSRAVKDPARHSLDHPDHP